MPDLPALLAKADAMFERADAAARDSDCGEMDAVRVDGGPGSGPQPGSGGEKKKIAVSALKTKLESMPHAKLMASLNNNDVDPAIKKHIERELDDRANRGTSKGHGENWR